MDRDEKKGQFDGFLMNIVIYTIAMFIASLFPFVARTILSIFIKTPGMVELKADGSYLFDVIYPLVGFFTFAAFIFGGWYCCYFAAAKISYKTGDSINSFKTKIQMILPALIMFIFNVYEGFAYGFSGLMGIQFWYPAATLSSLFGTFDKTDLLGTLTNIDLETNNFVIKGIANEFVGLTILFAVLYSVLFAFACYYGRKKGMQIGIKKKTAYLDSIRNGSTHN